MKAQRSSMVPVGVNLAYVDNFKLLKEDENASPSTLAMHWCMLACGVNRIFNEEDLKEFLFRLPITLQGLQLLDSWFAYDQLMNYKVGNNHSSFSADDIFLHYGIEVIDAVDHFRERELWLENFEKNLKSAMTIGALIGIEVIPLRKDAAADTYIIEVGEISHLLTDKLFKDAEFFSQDVLRLAPEDLYKNQDRFDSKLQEIEERKQVLIMFPNLSLMPSLLNYGTSA